MPGSYNRLRADRIPAYLLMLVVPILVFLPTGKPITPSVLPLYVTPGVFLTDLVILSGMASLFISFFKGGIREWTGLHISTLLIAIPLLIIIILAFITSPFGISPALARYTAVRWLLALVVYLVVLVSDIPLTRLFVVLIFGMAVQAIIGLAQVVHQGPLGIPGELALEINQSRAAVIILNGLTWLRPYGLTFHPNVLGGFLFVGLVLGLALIDRPLVRFSWWLLFAALMLSFSRSAWIAAALVLPPTIAWIYWRLPPLRRALLLTILPVSLILIFGAILFKDQILTRLNPFQTFSEFTSISERGRLITIALANMRENWLTGIGAGNFPLSMLGYSTLDPPQYVHNVALLLASEVGLLGGLAWYWLWIVPPVMGMRYIKSEKVTLVVLIAAWFGWVTISLLDSYPWALESGRLFSMVLLAWISKECIS